MVNDGPIEPHHHLAVGHHDYRRYGHERFDDIVPLCREHHQRRHDLTPTPDPF
jgi:hypothetical protein